MNEKEVMHLINSIDDDLADEKIDELLNEKGEYIDMDRIKKKSMDKLNQNHIKKQKINKKAVIAAAAIATLTFSTVSAKEISKVIQSFFNKSVVYSTVVDGDAYYLPEAIKLNDQFTLVNASVSKDSLDMTIKNEEQTDDKVSRLGVAVVPLNNENIRYTIGGYGFDENGAITCNFFNETENSRNIIPFKDFRLTIDGESYDISLAKAENLKTSENFVVGLSENTAAKEDAPAKETESSATQDTKLIANVAGSIEAADGITNIQLAASFEDSDLKLSAFGESEFSEFNHAFENEKNGIISSSTGTRTKPIIAYDKNNNAYTLQTLENAVRYPITIFETTADPSADLTVHLPAILARYEKEVTNCSFSIPKEGEAAVNTELDFIIQKATAKSIKRVSEDTVIIEIDLNTGSDKTVFLSDIGAYSKDVIKADTVIKGNTATITMKIDPNIEKADFSFSWPHYILRGNWTIGFGQAK